MNEALAIAPRNTKTHLFIADVLKSAGRHQEAEKHFLEVIAIDPTDPTAYVELMTIYGQAGLWQQAEKVSGRDGADDGQAIPAPVHAGAAIARGTEI